MRADKRVNYVTLLSGWKSPTNRKKLNVRVSKPEAWKNGCDYQAKRSVDCCGMKEQHRSHIDVDTLY